MLIDKAKNDWLPRQIAERHRSVRNQLSAVNQGALPRSPRGRAGCRSLRQSTCGSIQLDPGRIGAVGRVLGWPSRRAARGVGEGPTDVGARVRVAVSWSGPMDLPGLLTGRQDVVSAVETFLGCSAPANCADAAREASPITHVDPSDGAVYLANSTDEIIPESQAEEMAAALERSGVAPS